MTEIIGLSTAARRLSKSKLVGKLGVCRNEQQIVCALSTERSVESVYQQALSWKDP